ncbi:MAG: Gfo/Idh/MocA family oxidoreductase [Spirochaetes bacterium]|nr:Gfo/Idh/MocA family oxidoreductase [Spirochaetota bacterium]
MAAKPFRVGFIGAGGIAHTHAKNLLKVEGVELVCAADVNETGLEKFKTEQKVGKTYKDFKEMLAKEKGNIDAVSVCTPNGLHAENTIAALNAGYHVIVEKPMAMTSKECRDMIAAAKKAGKHLVVGFQWRFNPKTVMIKKQADDGVFGKILYVRVQALRRRGIPNWGVFGRKELQGGGGMIDIGVHASEMAHYVMGCPKPVSATGNAWTYMGNKPSEVVSQWPNWDHKTYTVEDLAVGMVRFDNGAMMTIESSFCTHIEKDIWNFQILGEKGGATFDPLMVFKDEHGYMWNEAPGFIPGDDQFALKMKHFVEVCRDGRTNESSGEHGLAVQQWLEGIYLSAEKGREVKIDELP